MKDDQDWATGEYTIPEIESTVAGCDMIFKAYFEDTPQILFTKDSKPIGIVNTLKEPRKIKFNVPRTKVTTTLTFMIEVYIPGITSEENNFRQQMSVFIDGKIRAKVVALKPDTFRK